MKVCILGGKTSIDVIFLSQLAQLYSSLDIKCYGDSGNVSFGKRVLEIEDIKKFSPSEFDIIINLSSEFVDFYEVIKDSGAIYINLNYGELLFVGSEEKILKLPSYFFNPLVTFLNIIKDNLKSLNIVSSHPIAEFGKDAMKKFHRQVHESAYIVREVDEKEVFAFNVSFNMFDKEMDEFGSSSFEKKMIEELSSIVKLDEISFSLTSLFVPINKAGSIILNFELNKEIGLDSLKKLIEKVGITYSHHPISSILVENDDQIFAIRLRKNKQIYSVILLYDSIFRRVSDLIEFFNSIYKL